VRLSVSQPKEITQTSAKRNDNQGNREATEQRSPRDTVPTTQRQENPRENREAKNRMTQPSERQTASRWVTKESTADSRSALTGDRRVPSRVIDTKDREQNKAEPVERRTGGYEGGRDGNSWQSSDRRPANGGDRDTMDRPDDSRSNRRGGATTRGLYEDNRRGGGGGYGGDRPRGANYGNSDRDYDREYNDCQRQLRAERNDDRVSDGAQHNTRTIQNSSIGRFEGRGGDAGRSYQRDDRYSERTITTPARRSQDVRFDGEDIVGGIRNITVNSSASSQGRSGGASSQEVGGRATQEAGGMRHEKRSTTIVQGMVDWLILFCVVDIKDKYDTYISSLCSRKSTIAVWEIIYVGSGHIDWRYLRTMYMCTLNHNFMDDKRTREKCTLAPSSG